MTTLGQIYDTGCVLPKTKNTNQRDKGIEKLLKNIEECHPGPSNIIQGDYKVS